MREFLFEHRSAIHNIIFIYLINRRIGIQIYKIKIYLQIFNKKLSDSYQCSIEIHLSITSIKVFHQIMSIENIYLARSLFIRVDWIPKSFVEVSQRELRAAKVLRGVERAARSARRVVLSGTVVPQRPRPLTRQFLQ